MNGVVMSQESNLSYLGLSHLIDDHAALQTAITQRIEAIEAGRTDAGKDRGMILARCRKELNRLARWPEIEKEREFFRSIKGGRIVSIAIDGKQVYPRREKRGSMSFRSLLDHARRPISHVQQDDAVNVNGDGLSKDLQYERLFEDANTGLLNRLAWNNYPVIGDVLVVDVKAMLGHLASAGHAQLGNAVADRTGRALYEAMQTTRQSVKAYRLAPTRFGVQCLDAEQMRAVVACVKRTLAQARVRQCAHGRCDEITGIIAQFGHAKTYADAVRQVSYSQ